MDHSLFKRRVLDFPFEWIIILIPALWLTGLHINDIARGLSFLLLACFVWAGRKLFAGRLEPSARLLMVFRIFLAAYGCFLLTEPWLGVLTGSHGLDFAIFTQSVDSIHRFGIPYTSLISMTRINFLSHHFAPFLYVPALLTWLGIPAYAALSIMHALCGIIAGVVFHAFAKELKLSGFLALTATVLLFANPSVRHGLFYGVHDEMFALPFLMLAYWAWAKGRLGWAVIALLGAASTKETLSAIGVAMIGMFILDPKTTIKRHEYWFLLAAALLMSSLFFGYSLLQPLLFGKPFDHISKIASLAQLSDPHMLFDKAVYLLFLLLPLLFFPLLAWRQWYLFLPATPLIGIMLVSNFQDMWAPLNYYGVLPSFLIYAGAMVAVSRNPVWVERLQSRFLLAIMICLAFSFSTKKPMKTIIHAIRLPTFSSEPLAVIPSESRVIASPAAALFLFRTRELWRLGNASQKVPEHFDFIVKKKDDLETIEPELASRVELCRTLDNWLIYCARESGTAGFEP